MLSNRSFRRGAIGGDKMFAAGLIIIIVGAAALTVYFGFIEGSGGSKGKGGPALIWFECSKCNEQFSLDTSTMNQTERMELMELESGMQPHAINCQKCGAKRKAFQMVTCPNPDCGKRYVPVGFRNPMAQMQNPEKYKDVCPHCNMELRDARKKARDAR